MDLSTDGMQQNVMLSQGRAMDRGPDGIAIPGMRRRRPAGRWRRVTRRPPRQCGLPRVPSVEARSAGIRRASCGV